MGMELDHNKQSIVFDSDYTYIINFQLLQVVMVGGRNIANNLQLLDNRKQYGLINYIISNLRYKETINLYLTDLTFHYNIN
jgi:hypothetical protein